MQMLQHICHFCLHVNCASCIAKARFKGPEQRHTDTPLHVYAHVCLHAALLRDMRMLQIMLCTSQWHPSNWLVLCCVVVCKARCWHATELSRSGACLAFAHREHRVQQQGLLRFLGTSPTVAVLVSMRSQVCMLVTSACCKPG